MVKIIPIFCLSDAREALNRWIKVLVTCLMDSILLAQNLRRLLADVGAY